MAYSDKTSLINLPVPTKVPHQKSIDVNDLFLTRFLPPWSRPASLPAYTWRAWVLNQPVAIDCRETLIASTLALDWKITPVNSNYREELDGTIKYYTKLFKNGGEYAGLGLDYTGLIEWIAADILDTPFGGAAEIGHKGGEPNGRVQWIRPLDAGTLYPTLNQEYPVIQYWQGWDAVVFQEHEISRVYMSPHTFIWREGWGMAPPEKVYFAMDLLGRGDKYYANLLLDIPTAGILDLGDMEKSSAEEWITAFKTFVNDNTTSFRVPVLYEHNNKVEFIPFGKVPNDIMFDRITLKYAALVCAAYGMSLSDIGLQTTSASGETLAGSIRQERRTRKTGFARLKKKLKAFFDKILPPTLEFNFIDYDDELNVALGKARLATATALGMMQDKGQISAQEARSQMIQDGLMSIAMPDAIPPDAQALPPQTPFGSNKEPEMNPEKVAPSAGGEGEVKSFVVKSKRGFDKWVETIVREATPKILDSVSSFSEDEIELVHSLVSESLFAENDGLGIQSIVDALSKKSVFTFSLDAEEELRSLLGDEYKDVNMRPYIDTLESSIKKSLNGFVGRIVIFTLNNVLHENSVFAQSEDIQYNLIVDSVQSRINKSLQEFVSVLVREETDKTLNQIRMEN
jgi:hypothetical protein